MISSRILLSLSFVLLAYFCYGLYISQSTITILAPGIKRENPPGLYDYRGAINVQTDLSSGSAHATHVIDEARRAGLDFLILTDINLFEQAESFNGYHDNLLVMSEAEYSFLDSRVMVVNDEPVRMQRSAGDVNVFLTDLLSQNKRANREALAILAYPFIGGQQTWTGAYPPGLHGLEVLNPKSIGMRAYHRSKLDVLWSFLSYPFNSRYAFLRLFREPNDEILVWDKLSEQREFFGFAGADASSRAVPLANMFVRFPGYQKSLEIVSNHILLNSELTGSFAKDRQKIFAALKQGRFYFAIDLLGDPRGFAATVLDREKTFMMGSRIPFNPGMRLQARLGQEPQEFYEILLYRNGQRELVSNQSELQYEIKAPGTYRIVVRVIPLLPLPDAKKWITWIYSNPFFVFDPKEN